MAQNLDRLQCRWFSQVRALGVQVGFRSRNGNTRGTHARAKVRGGSPLADEATRLRRSSESHRRGLTGDPRPDRGDAFSESEVASTVGVDWVPPEGL
jgi:hypothetical protein